MIKKIAMPDIRGIIVREPINIDEPIFLEDHLPYPSAQVEPHKMRPLSIILRHSILQSG